MNWLLRSTTRAIPIVFLLFAGSWVIQVNPAIADDDYRLRKKHDKSISGTFLHPEKDKGNEATGEAAAWLFAIANITVAISLASKTATKLSVLSDDTKKRIKLINQTQKRYGMAAHFVLNPVALTLACTHFYLSYCRSTTLPEWGLLTMASLVLLGIVLKFRIAPKAIRMWTYLIHTSPWALASAVLILIAGHAMMD